MEKFIDPEIDITSSVAKSLANRKTCLECKHLKRYTDSFCPAFDVIPIDILTGDITHDKPMFGQKNKIIFEPR